LGEGPYGFDQTTGGSFLIGSGRLEAGFEGSWWRRWLFCFLSSRYGSFQAFVSSCKGKQKGELRQQYRPHLKTAGIKLSSLIAVSYLIGRSVQISTHIYLNHGVAFGTLFVSSDSWTHTSSTPSFPSSSSPVVLHTSLLPTPLNVFRSTSSSPRYRRTSDLR